MTTKLTAGTPSFGVTGYTTKGDGTLPRSSLDLCARRAQLASNGGFRLTLEGADVKGKERQDKAGHGGVATRNRKAIKAAIAATVLSNDATKSLFTKIAK